MDENCVFCRIIAGDIPADILHRDADCFAIADIAPKAPTHLLIIPTQHFTYLSGLTPEFLPVLGSMHSAAKRLAEERALTESGYRLVINQGEHSGQEVAHLHMHLLGGRQLGAMG